jgi:hypothetical protein
MANQWNIGDVKISRIVESEGPWDGNFLLPDATRENIQKERDWLYPTFSDEKGKLVMSIHSLVISRRANALSSIPVSAMTKCDRTRCGTNYNSHFCRTCRRLAIRASRLIT